MENKISNVSKKTSKAVNSYLILKDAHKQDDATFMKCGVNFDSKNVVLPKHRETPKILNICV